MFGLSYWFLPLFAGCVWLGTLLAMLGRYVAIGSPHYAWQADGQYRPYISDIGASSWGKPLFIAGSAVTVVVFDLAFISERWLRHKGRLAHNVDTSEKILSIFATLAAIVGAAGLILLTIFDEKNHDRVHVAMLCVFIAGYWVSAIFICAEYQRLGVKYREYTILAVSFWIKLFFILVELALVIAFGVLSHYKMYNEASPFEWIISLVFIFYVWSSSSTSCPPRAPDTATTASRPSARASTRRPLTLKPAATCSAVPYIPRVGTPRPTATTTLARQRIFRL